MALRFYLVPKAGDGLTPATAFRPMYVADLGVLCAAMDYGLEDLMLVGADVTPAQHSAIAAHADVTAIPANLDAQIGGNLATVQAALEGWNLPAQWVTSGMTYRVVIGKVGRLLKFMERYRGRQLARFFATTTLDALVSSLSQAQRDSIHDTADSLGLDTSSITGSMTIRQALKILLEQLDGFTLAGEAF